MGETQRTPQLASVSSSQTNYIYFDACVQNGLPNISYRGEMWVLVVCRGRPSVLVPAGDVTISEDDVCVLLDNAVPIGEAGGHIVVTKTVRLL